MNECVTNETCNEFNCLQKRENSPSLIYVNDCKGLIANRIKLTIFDEMLKFYLIQTGFFALIFIEILVRETQNVTYLFRMKFLNTLL